MGIETAFLAATVGGSLLNRKSSKDAVNAQSASADQANELQRYMFDQQRADTQPYRDAGTSALGQIQKLLKDPRSVTKDPGYLFGLGEGRNALENSATARGMTYSGAQAKALQRFGNDYASSKIDQTYNRLSNLAGIGQVGVNPEPGMNYANNVGANMLGVGNAQGAGAIARGSAYGNALNSGLAYGDRNGWFSGGGGGSSFGGPLDNFYGGNGTSGD